MYFISYKLDLDFIYNFYKFYLKLNLNSNRSIRY